MSDTNVIELAHVRAVAQAAAKRNRYLLRRSVLLAALIACAAIVLADEHTDNPPATHRDRRPGDRIA